MRAGQKGHYQYMLIIAQKVKDKYTSLKV